MGTAQLLKRYASCSKTISNQRKKAERKAKKKNKNKTRRAADLTKPQLKRRQTLKAARKTFLEHTAGNRLRSGDNCAYPSCAATSTAYEYKACSKINKKEMTKKIKIEKKLAKKKK